ncbi:MAG: hypothetical protein ACI9SC_002584 [Gammaproteobacteria bacterium]|jgi:hypothetical protein
MHAPEFRDQSASSYYSRHLVGEKFQSIKFLYIIGLLALSKAVVCQ